ncbi:MAG: acyl-ACP--UDP-N-acetylglucosamine O-acyltransferase [Phycisphaerae bacterium]|jgi:UDP-N-acetylglucosamine acyltransferase
MPKIHPTAIVHGSAQLGQDVEIGPYCMVESDVQIGPGTVLREHVIVRRYTTLGAGNFVDTFCVLGGEPQDFKFDPQTVSYLRIGDGNVFRENVTISRATGQGNATVVGNKTYWMGGTHAGHNVTVCDQVIFANHCGMAGYVTIGPRAVLSGHVVIHQFCWLGELAVCQGGTALGMHIPPYTMCGDGVNHVIGLNVVGLRRATDISDADRQQIREAFHLTYRSGLNRKQALEAMDAHTEWGPAAGKFRDFVRKVYQAAKPYNRGLCTLGSSKQSRIRQRDETD